MMKFSIIVPVYNVEQYIRDCILSIFNQTYTCGVECIIVDDCGTDDSMKIVEELLKDYTGEIKFSIIYHEQNKGLSAARNTGLSAAIGDYVMFVDSDDQITNDCLEILGRPLDNFAYDMVVPNYKIEGGDKTYTKCIVPNCEIIGHKKIAQSRLDDRWYVMAWAKLYRRQFLIDKKIEFCEGIIHEDELFASEVACLMDSMYLLGNAVTYIYRLRENSIMSSLIYEKRRESYIRILDHMNVFMIQNNLLKQYLPNELFLGQFYTAIKISLAISDNAYYTAYSEYRRACNLHICQLLYINKSFKKYVRDIHFFLPPGLGKKVFRFLFWLNN